MYAKVTSLGVTGLAGYIVQVEADLSGGLPQFNLVGLPDSAVKESSERVRSAIKNLHYEWPASRITINLAPADVRKTVSKIVNLMKSYTTYHIWKRYPDYLRKHFWKEHTFWTDGYFICSVGNVSEEMLRKYIENQG